MSEITQAQIGGRCGGGGGWTGLWEGGLGFKWDVEQQDSAVFKIGLFFYMGEMLKFRYMLLGFL